MIKQVYQKLVSQVMLLTAVSLCVMPANSSAAAYYGDNGCCEEPCNPCGSSIWDSKGFLILGSVALGAAAGAAAGAAVSSSRRGRSGDDGATGATGAVGVGVTGATGTTGPSPFAVDGANTLAFSITSTLSVAQPGETLTPYVSLPDGTTVIGAPVDAGVITPIVFPPIPTVAMFGTYEAGVLLSASNLATSITTTTDVVASRAPAETTTVVGPIIGLAATGNQAESNVPFVYAEEPIP